MRLRSVLLIGSLSAMAIGCDSSTPAQTPAPAVNEGASKSVSAPQLPETPQPGAARQPAASQLAAQQPAPTNPVADTSTPNPTVKTVMDIMVNPSGEFLFQSIADIADEHGITHKAPKTAREWEAVRHHLKGVDGRPGTSRHARPQGRCSRDSVPKPARENQPEQVQRLIDAQHSDFVRRAERLGHAAAVGLKAADAQDKDALFAAITEIDKACESCHLHYWYPNDVRAHQAAKEEGGIIE